MTYGRSSVKRLVVVGTNGRALLALNAEGFSLADASLFAAALRVRVDDGWEPVTASKLGREIPGAVSGIYRYAMVWGVVVAVVLSAGFVILAPRIGH